MSQVLDYSFARPDPAAIKAAGYVGVLRYVAPLGRQSGNAFGGADDSAKVIFAAEYNALRSAGLQVALNWEWYAARAKEGAAAGTADAQEALRQANTLNYRGCIYFSVDYDAPESDQPAINAYFEAAAQVIGLARLGAYAGYWPLKRLFDAGLISFGWQTLAWSGGNREGRAHLYQNGATAFNNGADVNDVLKADWTGGAVVAIPQGPFYEVTAGRNGVPAYGNAVAAAVGLTWQEICAIPGQPANLKDYDPTGPYLIGQNGNNDPNYGVTFLLPGFPPPVPDVSALEKEIADLKAQLAQQPPASAPSDADQFVTFAKKVFPGLS